MLKGVVSHILTDFPLYSFITYKLSCGTGTWKNVAPAYI